MPLRDDLLNPIAGDNPSGENLRYAPVYDQIKEARREEEEIAQGDWQHERKKADWPLVIKLTGEALAKKSKDLQIAAWLTEALLHREGFQGLKDGLDLTRNLLETFWDTLYPEIEEGDLEMRATPLEWIGSRLDQPIRQVTLTRSGLDWLRYKDSRSVPYETDTAKAEQRAQAVQDGKLTPEEFDEAVSGTPTQFYEDRMTQLVGCLESTDALAALCDEKFGDYSPNFNSLKKSLEEIRQVVHVLLAKRRQAEAPAAQAEPEASAGYEQAAGAGYGAAAAPAPAAGALSAEPVDRDDAIARVIGAAKWLRQNDAYSPAPYMLIRALRWGELMAGAPEPDASLLEAPQSEVRQEIKKLFTDGYYQEALEAAENAVGQPCGRAWLDVHRYAVQACENLGYNAVATAIKSGLRALLADIPALPDRSLMDDTPTANGETRQWIQEQIATAPAAAAAPADNWYSQPAEAEPEEQIESEGPEKAPDTYEMALQAARSGDARGAIELLSRDAAQAPSGRARFQRNVQLAQICLGSKHSALAIPILQSLAEEIDKRGLEEWEAHEMLAHALGLLYRAAQSGDMSAEDKHKLYRRICRLDPVQALGLSR